MFATGHCKCGDAMRFWYLEKIRYFAEVENFLNSFDFTSTQLRQVIRICYLKFSLYV